jgi:hypothetical protein
MHEENFFRPNFIDVGAEVFSRGVTAEIEFLDAAIEWYRLRVGSEFDQVARLCVLNESAGSLRVAVSNEE